MSKPLVPETAPDAAQGATARAEARAHKTPTLEEVLAYRNSDVVYRFAKSYGLTREESEDIFDQVKKWMWLGNERLRNGQRAGLAIDLPLVAIDEMWHNFVLFTREYTAFCERYFGYYMHHAPVTEAEDDETLEKYSGMTPAERRQARSEQLRPQYEYIYDRLGRDTFVKWYLEYPKVFSCRQLAQRQLDATLEKLDGARTRAAA